MQARCIFGPAVPGREVWFVPELNGEAFHNLGSDGDNLKVEIHDWLAQAR